METILIYAVPISYALCLLLPAGFVAWTGKWKRGILIAWGCFVGWFIVAGLLEAELNSQLAERLHLPETTAVGPALMVGWLPATVIGGFGFLLRVILVACWPWYAKKTAQSKAL